MTLLLGRLKFNDLLKVPRRCKNGPDHWSTLRRKVSPKDKALDHFNDFYQTVYGESWPLIRAALLKRPSKYMAVINNFGDSAGTCENFELLGAINLRSIYDVQRKNIPLREAKAKAKEAESKNNPDLKKRIKSARGKKQTSELKSVYPEDYEPPQASLEDASSDNKTKKLDEPLTPVQMKSIEEDLSLAKQDHTRIVNSITGITSSTLHEYIPATKIKGMDDWVLESEHYDYYNRGADFSVRVEKDKVLDIPEHLKIYTFEAQSENRFPNPRRGSVGVYDYFLMDGASILPVLALDLQPGDTVLDMCAAPGGKSFAALQTLMPRAFVANDSKLGRVNRINDVMDEYFGELGVWENRLFVTNKDARLIEDYDMFNKILVDVPCTTDRHVLHEDDNNLFKPSRLRERLRLPELQSELLGQALKIIAPGGTVVYSTCSLSPIQNDGVVQMALKRTWEETKSEMIVMDMTDAVEPLRCLYKFGDFGLKYGHIVIPSRANNWGPMYFCKIIRVR